MARTAGTGSTTSGAPAMGLRLLIIAIRRIRAIAATFLPGFTGGGFWLRFIRKSPGFSLLCSILRVATIQRSPAFSPTSAFARGTIVHWIFPFRFWISKEIFNIPRPSLFFFHSGLLRLPLTYLAPSWKTGFPARSEPLSASEGEKGDLLLLKSLAAPRLRRDIVLAERSSPVMQTQILG